MLLSGAFLCRCELQCETWFETWGILTNSELLLYLQPSLLFSKTIEAKNYVKVNAYIMLKLIVNL